MKEINYWEQFMQTGKVSDFLAYKNVVRDGQETDCSKKSRESGEYSHAGVYGDYGDCFKG